MYVKWFHYILNEFIDLVNMTNELHPHFVYIYIYISLNPMPNAQVCVFDSTYYKITTTNYSFKTSLYTTFRMYSSGPWPLKILMFALLVTREIATYSWPW
jgi:hypothetical protein